MARTPSKTETREEMIYIRVTRAELAEVLDAVPMDQSISSWSRAVILDQIRGSADTVILTKQPPE